MPGEPVEFVLKFWIGDGDQRLRALAHGLAVQISHAMFRYYIVYVGPAGDYAGAGGQSRHNTRHRSVLGRRGHGDDRLAAFGSRRSAHEVHLPSDSAVGLGSQRIGTDLPGEVD